MLPRLARGFIQLVLIPADLIGPRRASPLHFSNSKTFDSRMAAVLLWVVLTVGVLGEHTNRIGGIVGLGPAMRGANSVGWRTRARDNATSSSFLQIRSTGDDNGDGPQNFVASCDVCTYVLNNKIQRQPYLCRGLKDPAYQRSCVQVLESLMWWVANNVYWVNYGCQKTQNGAAIWVRPCPAHAVCSWIQQLYTHDPFCPGDASYPVPK